MRFLYKVFLSFMTINKSSKHSSPSSGCMIFPFSKNISLKSSPTIRLLIVDELESFFENIKECAELCSHKINMEVARARSGHEALEKIRDWEPTILVVDTHLPDMSGFELVRDCYKGVLPVVLTSEYRSSDLEKSARELGAYGYVPKTENIEDIENLLYELADISIPEWNKQ